MTHSRLTQPFFTIFAAAVLLATLLATTPATSEGNPHIANESYQLVPLEPDEMILPTGTLTTNDDVVIEYTGYFHNSCPVVAPVATYVVESRNQILLFPFAVAKEQQMCLDVVTPYTARAVIENLPAGVYEVHTVTNSGLTGSITIVGVTRDQNGSRRTIRPGTQVPWDMRWTRQETSGRLSYYVMDIQ